MRLGDHAPALRGAWFGTIADFRELVPGPASEFPSEATFLHAAPLLEKERNARCRALSPQGLHPFLSYRASAGATLAAHDHPMDPGEVNPPKVFKQRLDR